MVGVSRKFSGMKSSDPSIDKELPSLNQIILDKVNQMENYTFPLPLPDFSNIPNFLSSTTRQMFFSIDQAPQILDTNSPQIQIDNQIKLNILTPRISETHFRFGNRAWPILSKSHGVLDSVQNSILSTIETDLYQHFQAQQAEIAMNNATRTHYHMLKFCGNPLLSPESRCVHFIKSHQCTKPSLQDSEFCWIHDPSSPKCTFKDCLLPKLSSTSYCQLHQTNFPNEINHPKSFNHDSSSEIDSVKENQFESNLQQKLKELFPIPPQFQSPSRPKTPEAPSSNNSQSQDDVNQPLDNFGSLDHQNIEQDNRASGTRLTKRIQKKPLNLVHRTCAIGEDSPEDEKFSSIEQIQLKSVLGAKIHTETMEKYNTDT